MPWHSEQARNKRSRDDDFIRGSEKEKYDWNARQASSARETRQRPGYRSDVLEGKETLEGNQTSPDLLDAMQKTKSSSEAKAGGEDPAGSPGEVRLAPDHGQRAGGQGALLPVLPRPCRARHLCAPQRARQGGVSVKPEGTGITGLLLIQLHSVN